MPDSSVQEGQALNFPLDIVERLKEASQFTGKSVETIAYVGVLRHLEDLEDIADAEAVLDRIKRGEESVLSSEEMERLLAMDD